MCTEMLLLNLGLVFPRFTFTNTVFPQTQENSLCLFCCSKRENEIYLLFECPSYTPLKSRHMPDSINEEDNQKYFVRIMNDKLVEIFFI